MIAALLSLFFLITGIFKYRLLGIFIIIALPFSSSYYNYINLAGVFAYDFFFVGLFLSFLFSWNGKINKNINLIPVVAIFMYGIIAIQITPVDGSFIREFRPAILLLQAFILFSFKKPYSHNQIIRVLKVGMLSSIIFGIIALIFIVEENKPNNLNYSSLTTYVAVIVFLLREQFGNLINKNLNKDFKITVILSVVLIIMSWNRTIIIGLILVEGIKAFKNYKRFTTTLLIAPIILGLLYFVAMELGVDKIINSFSQERVLAQLSSRYGPAIPYLEDMNLSEILVGHGLGTMFLIPWFENWGNNPYFNFIDNTYLTFFVKYGIVGLGIISIIIVNLTKLGGNKLLSIFFIILFLTVAFPYQMSALGVYIGLSFLWQLKQLNNQNL